MAKTKQKEKTEQPDVAQEAKNAGALTVQEPEGPKGLRLRLQYPRLWGPDAGVDVNLWRVYIEAVWPSAQTIEAVMLAHSYCQKRGLDPMKKMVHIVPMSTKVGEDQQGKPIYKMVETVWPSIAEIRVTATRTGVYAGKDAIEKGPLKERVFRHEHNNKVTEKTVIYHEWMRLTVYKIVQGVRCAFVGPQVYWEETYATENRFSEVPNEMWADRTNGQHEKCTEAASLRSAFPEELGGEYASEEMYGRPITDHAKVQRALPAPIEGEVRPTPNMKSEFRPAAETEKGGAAAESKPEPQQAKVEPEPEKVTEPVKQKEPSAEETAAAVAVLDKILKDGIAGLPNIHGVGALADFREQIEQEIPPDGQHLKDWIVACERRQNELLELQCKKAAAAKK